MSAWLLEKNVIQIVLDYSHVEMVKRLPEILILLCKTNSLTPVHVDLLWNSIQGRH